MNSRTESGFTTKYCLTQGIFPVEIDLDRSSERYVYTTRSRLGCSIQLIPGQTFFRTIEEAKSNAMEQAERKVNSLKKRLLRMQELAATPMVSDGKS